MSEIEEEKKPKRSFMDYMSLVDFFSTQTSFSFEGEDSFKTLCGGATSLLIMLICLVVTVTDPQYYSNDIMVAEVVDDSPYTLDASHISIGITLVEAATNKTISLDRNWTVSFVCQEVTDFTNINVIGTFGSKRNCSNGDHCISDDFNCNLFKAASNIERSIAVNLNVCDTANSWCNLTALDQDYGLSSTKSYNLIMNVTRPRPNNQAPEWILYSSVLLMDFKLGYAPIYGSSPMRRQEFSTNSKFQGAIGLPLNKLVRYVPNDRTPQTPLGGFSTSSTSGMLVFSYQYVPDTRYNQYQQQFTDLSGMLSNYFAISGVILVLYSLLFSHYSENMMHISLGRHLHYITGSDRRPIDFSEANIKTIVTCAIYFRHFACCYPSCLRPQIAMIEAGRRKLNLNNMLEDLVQINSHDTGKNPLIKLQIDEEEEEEQQEYKEEEVKAALSDFMRNEINENTISMRDIEIFLEWVKLNHYTFEEGKEVALRLFTKQNASNDVFAENEAREFQLFKDSMKENDCDELYLVPSGQNDSNVALNDKSKIVEVVGEKVTHIKIKGDKEAGLRNIGLVVNDEDDIEPSKRSIKELPKLMIQSHIPLAEGETTNGLAESNMRVFTEEQSPMPDRLQRR